MCAQSSLGNEMEGNQFKKISMLWMFTLFLGLISYKEHAIYPRLL